MQEIAVSKFKATCLSVIEDVRRTRRPVRITKFGKPVAELVPAAPTKKKKSWLGCMGDWPGLSDDIVGPIGAFDNWPDGQP